MLQAADIGEKERIALKFRKQAEQTILLGWTQWCICRRLAPFVNHKAEWKEVNPLFPTFHGKS
jgi:hypothetical protein